MLPSAKRSLQKAGYSDQVTGFILLLFFVAGFVGIQIVSRFLHQFMPSHVISCDHTHEEPLPDNIHHHNHHDGDHFPHSHSHDSNHSTHQYSHGHNVHHVNHSQLAESSESTPLLSRDDEPDHAEDATRLGKLAFTVLESRPAIGQVQERVISFVKDTKANCDEHGPCYGFTDPCGQECRKHIMSTWLGTQPRRHPALERASTTPLCLGSGHPSAVVGNGDVEEESSDGSIIALAPCQLQQWDSRATNTGVEEDTCSSHKVDAEAQQQQHHHHVHNNAFLSIGLQTSIAIAIHKFPEGFITYATNHANPTLGFNVFMALFVHNITEGFALALPLYMALGSRVSAMIWASVLGGLSQPAGAALAVLWFHLAKRTSMNPNETVYACLFAITAGIMASVALQLFAEGLSLGHNRNLCIFFAFLGMVILSLSNALVGGQH